MAGIYSLTQVYNNQVSNTWPSVGIGTETTANGTSSLYTVDETTASNTFTVSISTVKYANGTVLYWSTSGNVAAADFVGGSNTGSFTVTTDVNGAGRFGVSTITLQMAADVTVEGNEEFNIQLRTGSPTGTVVASIPIINVTDTSAVTPLQLWGWGVNTAGAFGDGTTTNRSSPVQTVASGTNWATLASGLAESARTTGAIKSDGTLWMWGQATYGKLGDNSTLDKSSPVQTSSGGTTWSKLAIGTQQVIAIKTDNSLWFWGNNGSGQLGGGTGQYSNPTQSGSVPSYTWTEVASGANYNLAMTSAGNLYSWGNDDNKIITATNGTTGWSKISTMQSSFAGIKTDGTLWTAGNNTVGQLGDNSVTLRSSPVQTVAGGTNWQKVSSGGYATAAIKTDGTLWTWGQGSFGVLGDSSNTNKSSPVQTTAGGTTWTNVSVNAFGRVGAGVKTDGTLWTWGANNYGQLGTNSTGSGSSSPVQTIAGGTSWVDVKTGFTYVIATKS